MSGSGSIIAFVCSYGDGGNGGIFGYVLDEATGGFIELGMESATAATYMAINRHRMHLYTVNRVSGGVVTAYDIDSETYSLSAIDRVTSGGSGPSYISLDRNGRYAFVSNYSEGTIAMLAIKRMAVSVRCWMSSNTRDQASTLTVSANLTHIPSAQDRGIVTYTPLTSEPTRSRHIGLIQAGCTHRLHLGPSPPPELDHATFAFIHEGRSAM